MKVFDLGCVQGHAFEGWFDSEEDYGQQKERGLLECPLCGTRDVRKRPSAPRLNLRHSALAESASASEAAEAGAPSHAVMPPSPEAAATMALMHEAWLRAVRHVIEHTEDVG
jgi:hypothetical protein